MWVSPLVWFRSTPAPATAGPLAVVFPVHEVVPFLSVAPHGHSSIQQKSLDAGFGDAVLLCGAPVAVLGLLVEAHGIQDQPTLPLSFCHVRRFGKTTSRCEK